MVFLFEVKRPGRDGMARPQHRSLVRPPHPMNTSFGAKVSFNARD